MGQLSLFDSTDGVMTDDERGRIIYRAAFIDPETAEAWFTELRHAVSWRAERRQMYDREVAVPRLIGHCRLDSSSSASRPPFWTPPLESRHNSRFRSTASA